MESGKSYTVPADPSRSGYDFLYWTSGGNRYYAGNTIQVNENITLTANWKEQKDDSSSGSSDNERTYAIITEDDGNGSVTVSADEASAGTRITVTVKPDAGYELDELTVTDSKNKDLKVTKRSETTYTFHMADSKVTVEASFTKTAPSRSPTPALTMWQRAPGTTRLWSMWPRTVSCPACPPGSSRPTRASAAPCWPRPCTPCPASHCEGGGHIC